MADAAPVPGIFVRRLAESRRSPRQPGLTKLAANRLDLRLDSKVYRRDVTSLKISQLAERSGVPATTLRFYESAGLLPAERPRRLSDLR